MLEQLKAAKLKKAKASKEKRHMPTICGGDEDYQRLMQET